MNETLIYISGIIAFIAYTTCVIIKFGVQPSISESYYRLNNAGRLLFASFIMFVALPPIIILESNLAYLAGVLLMMVGIAEDTKANKTTRIVHMVGAIAGIVLFSLAIAIEYKAIGLPLLALVVIYNIIPMTQVKNRVWWIEYWAFVINYWLLAMYLGMIPESW